MLSKIKATKSENGFIIIEVALVLAVAGLIFLVVFLALPALQKSQKDTAAREAVGQTLNIAQNFLVDNGDTWVADPSDIQQWIDMENNHFSPYIYGQKIANGSTSFAFSSPLGPNLPSANTMQIQLGGLCGNNLSSTASASASDGSGVFNVTQNSSATKNGKSVSNERSAAIAIKLSNGNYYCQDI